MYSKVMHAAADEAVVLSIQNESVVGYGERWCPAFHGNRVGRCCCSRADRQHDSDSDKHLRNNWCAWQRGRKRSSID
jgi:hypothetical protein